MKCLRSVGAGKLVKRKKEQCSEATVLVVSWREEETWKIVSQ